MQIVKLGLMTEAEFDEASRKALSLFDYGQVIPFMHTLFIVISWLKFDGSEIYVTTISIHQSTFIKTNPSPNNVPEESINVARKILRFMFYTSGILLINEVLCSGL